MTAILNQRQLQMLHALRKRPCATLGPSDLIDKDYLTLAKLGYVKEYWGTGGVHCTVSDDGWQFMGFVLKDEGNGISRWVSGAGR